MIQGVVWGSAPLEFFGPHYCVLFQTKYVSHKDTCLAILRKLSAVKCLANCVTALCPYTVSLPKSQANKTILGFWSKTFLHSVHSYMSHHDHTVTFNWWI